MIVKNTKYFVDLVNSSKANQFVEYYHYSHTGFKKAQLNLGVYDINTNKLVGVMQWGCSAQENVRLDKYVKEPLTKHQYFELNRFCMADTDGQNSESQALGLGIKWIKHVRPDIKLLVSYAGRKEGNVGYIYQATNWEYLGYFISPGFWNIDGKEMHQFTLWYHYNKGPYAAESFLEAIQKMYSYIEQTWTKQFIYIQRLDKSLTLASPVLPYPKTEDGPILVKNRIYKDGPIPVIEDYKKLHTIPDFYYNPDELMFSRRKLIRDGELDSQKFQVASYDDWGHLIEVRPTATAYGPTYSCDGIRKSCTDMRFYKDRYFKKFPYYMDVPKELEVPTCCIIDEIPFRNITEAAKYLNVSRQAVSAAKLKNKDMVAGKRIIWIDI